MFKINHFLLKKNKEAKEVKEAKESKEAKVVASVKSEPIHAKVVEEKPVPVEVKQPEPKPVIPPVPAPMVVQSSEAAKKNVDLSVRAKKNSWLLVKADGMVVFQGTLKKGVTESWSADKEIELSGKNISQLEFEVNGKMVGALSSRDTRAKMVIITKNGLSTKK